MTRIFTRLGLAAGLALAATAAGAQDLPGNLRIVIGSTSTGGDTYQTTAIVAEALAAHAGINVKVDAVGPTEAFKALERDARGSTIVVFHDQSYLGQLYGVKGYDDIFETYAIGPTLATNPGNAYLVPKASPYQSVGDIIAAAGNGDRIRVAIQPGGVSEIGFSALKNAVRIQHPGAEENVVAVNTGSQADKDQLLFDGQADLINGSVQANEQYTRLPEDDQKAMRFVWLTARNETIAGVNEEGMGETTRDALLAFTSPDASVTQDGTTDFTFDKDFFVLYNKDTDPALIAAFDAALGEVFAGEAIGETMRAAFLVPNFLPSAEAQAYLAAKRDAYAEVISSITADATN